MSEYQDMYPFTYYVLGADDSDSTDDVDVDEPGISRSDEVRALPDYEDVLDQERANSMEGGE